MTLWKRQEETWPAQPPPPDPAPAAPPDSKENHVPTTVEAGRDSAYVGGSIHIRGEIQGQEDLFLDGEIEGNIRLPGQRLVIGPNARIHGQILAREVLVQGKVQGNIQAQNRLEIQRTGWVQGELHISRIAIEDGAYFKGSVEIAPVSSGTAAQPQPPLIQSSWLENKY